MALMFEPAKVPFMGATKINAMKDANLVVFGAPHGTPYTGIDNSHYAAAPEALRHALDDDARDIDHWDFDVGGPLLGDVDFVVADVGDIKTSTSSAPENRQQIADATAQIVQSGAIPLMIGGDDSTPIPFIKALAPHGPLTVIQIDAHIDWRDERFGETLGFSNTMRRASEFAHVEKIIQVGIRGLGSARQIEFETAKNWGAKIITARQLHREGLESVLQHLEKDTNCMVTFDCDGLDPSIMPAVMARTPGGLSYFQAIDLIAAIVKKANLVAFDMVEFVPKRDLDGYSAFTAARIIANVIGNLARK